MKKKHLLYKIILLLIIIILFLAIVEKNLRAQEDRKISRDFNNKGMYMISKNVLLGYESKQKYINLAEVSKNGTIQEDRESYSYIKLNNIGFRDDYFEKDDKPLMIIIGDSVTFGHEVNQEKIFPKLLDEQLENYNILNMGVSGYSIIQELELLKNKGLELEPSRVLWIYTLNDPADHYLPPLNILGRNEMIERENEIITKLDLGLKCKIYNNLRKSRIIINTLRAYEKITGQKPKFLITIDGGEDFNYLHKNSCYFDRVEYVFEELENIQNKENLNLTMIIVPILVDFENYKYLESHAKVKSVAEKRNLEVYDFYEDLKEYNYKDLQRDEGDSIHFGELGHKIIADLLIEKMFS